MSVQNESRIRLQPDPAGSETRGNASRRDSSIRGGGGKGSADPLTLCYEYLLTRARKRQEEGAGGE
jgi:hypothetical protein